MIRVVVADDHHLVRQGIRALLEKPGDIQVVGEAADGQEAIELVEQTKPDVLLIDLVMPRMNGAQVVQRLRSMDLPIQVIILSMYSDDTLVRQALRSGARGYLLKRSVTEELLLAVRSAARGEIYLSPAVSGNLLSELMTATGAEDETSAFERLSAREKEVLQLIAEGKTNGAIAQIMQVSEKTIEKHRANLMAKLGLHDLASLIRTAIKHGLISLDD